MTFELGMRAVERIRMVMNDLEMMIDDDDGDGPSKLLPFSRNRVQICGCVEVSSREGEWSAHHHHNHRHD